MTRFNVIFDKKKQPKKQQKHFCPCNNATFPEDTEAVFKYMASSFIHLPPSVLPPTFLSLSLSVCLSVSLSLSFSVRLSVRLCLSVSLSFCLSVCLSLSYSLALRIPTIPLPSQSHPVSIALLYASSSMIPQFSL